MGQPADANGPLKSIWSFFASVKLTVVLLLTLAATSVFGTLIPQMGSPDRYVAIYGAFTYRLFALLDLFDMYHSWWFELLLLLLAANIVICSVDRLSSVWKIVFVKKPRFKLSQFQKLSTRAQFAAKQDADRLKSAYGPYFAKHFHYSRIEPHEKGFCVFAEKGRWTRLGVYIVHLSVILLLIGGLVGSLLGFDGFVNVGEGVTVDRIRLRSSKGIQPLDFAIRCDDFTVTFYKSGAPKEYRSTLTILEKGRPVMKKDILVNHPLNYRGINIYQASYGTLAPQKFQLRFQDKASKMVFKKQAVIGRTIELPESRGSLLITKYSATASFRGHAIGEALVGRLTLKGHAPQPILLPLRFPSFDKMRGGAMVIAVDSYDPRYYTGLQVTRDPGVPIVYAGFIIIIAGCFITFFLSHQRICVQVIPKGKGAVVTVMGTSNKNKIGMPQKVSQLAKKLAKLKL